MFLQWALGRTKLHPLYGVNCTHLFAWRLHAKFQPDQPSRACGLHVTKNVITCSDKDNQFKEKALFSWISFVKFTEYLACVCPPKKSF